MRKINLRDIAELPSREQQRVEQFLRRQGLSNPYYPRPEQIRARQGQDYDEAAIKYFGDYANTNFKEKEDYTYSQATEN